jgi:uncharacterized repeat protein (TIGR03803 family)
VNVLIDGDTVTAKRLGPALRQRTLGMDAMFKIALHTTAALLLATAFGAPRADAKAPKLLYEFQGGTNGSAPYADLVFYKGLFYGTTYSDGLYGAGTIFSFDPGSGKQTVLYAFNGDDGYAPAAAMIEAGGRLYGSTLNGGSASDGTIFSIDPKTGKVKTLYTFAGQANNGADPVGDLATDGTYIYGVTFYGGTAGAGAIFKVNIKTGTQTIIYSFTGGSDGARPHGGLLLQGGILYGTTEFGASNTCNDASAPGCGTVFKIDPTTNSFAAIYGFQGGADGANPAGGLIAANGLLYGTTTQGGGTNCENLGCGTVFQIDPATGVETVLYSFNNGTIAGDGTYPFGGVSYLNGALYGMTQAGGHKGCDGGAGTLYKIDLTTNAETQLYAYHQKEGCPYPVSRPIYHGHAFYGSTPGGGGAPYGGNIFKFKP